MKRLLGAFIGLFITFCYASASTVIGSVNSNPVTDSDITARVNLMAKQGKTSATNRKQAFQNIIDDYIKLNYAANFNVNPSDSDADKEIERMNLGEMDATMKAVARLAVRAEIAWQVIIARTIIPTTEVSKSEISTEKISAEKEYGLPIDVTLIRLSDIPQEVAAKLSKPKNCEDAIRMAEGLGGYPQQITAAQYELSKEMRERLAGLPILTWSKHADNSVVLICAEKKQKEYKNLDEIIKQNAIYKKANAAADQQLKQLRRKAVIIINDDKYRI